jgi:hypothetical protein
MAISYLDAIRQGFPTVMAVCTGNPFIYDNLDWTGGDALPSQDDLDLWISENPGWNPTLELTKYEFRKLFTLNEKVAIDNVQANAAIPANYRAILVSVMKDLELSQVIHLDNPDVINGVTLLVQLGLITTARKDQILSNTAYTV